MNEEKKVILMCKDDCCPTVTIGLKEVIIEDDFGGKVKLTTEQFELFKEKVKEGEL